MEMNIRGLSIPCNTESNFVCLLLLFPSAFFDLSQKIFVCRLRREEKRTSRYGFAVMLVCVVVHKFFPTWYLILRLLHIAAWLVVNHECTYVLVIHEISSDQRKSRCSLPVRLLVCNMGYIKD
ncbi:hypothetical protein TanjilG_04723 [Lupinus angustifolius]|uniref:Uncharacterized protein n=1 Tax=Lupinus angustifolius TaxID=3871 RepID=A0A4P1RKD5_LUPAN|nr:hypothetical protein TanjilG_04723 [Lupinus angustifolius]